MDLLNNPPACQLIKPLLPKPLGTQKHLLPRRAHNAWTLGLLLINTKNPAGLGINIDGTAAEAWTSYINTYKKASNMTQLNAEQILQNAMYSDRTDLNDFIIDMHNKWSDARALGSTITDEDFKDIIISSLPES